MFEEVKKEDAPGKEVFRVIFLSDEPVRFCFYKGNVMITKNSPIFMGLLCSMFEVEICPFLKIE